MNAKLDPVENLESKSTLYQKLGPEERKKLNRAIVDRSQPTYRACYDHFRLADRGIGFSSFYRYARNLRHQATLLDLAESRGEQNSDPVALNEAVTHLLLCRLIEAGDDETADSHELLRLARAHHLTARTQKLLLDNLDRKNDAGPALRKKEADEMIKMARAHAALFRRQLKQQLIDYKNSRPDPDDDDSGFPISKLYEKYFGVPDDEADDEPHDDRHDPEQTTGRSCENPFSHAPRQESTPGRSSNTKTPSQHAPSNRDAIPNEDERGNSPQASDQDEPEAPARESSPNTPTPDTSRESLYPPDGAPRVNAVIESIKQGWARRNAENLARAKPGSAHEKIARIYANPKPIGPDVRPGPSTASGTGAAPEACLGPDVPF